jgi:hypothetical protein
VKYSSIRVVILHRKTCIAKTSMIMYLNKEQEEWQYLKQQKILILGHSNAITIAVGLLIQLTKE